MRDTGYLAPDDQLPGPLMGREQSAVVTANAALAVGSVIAEVIQRLTINLDVSLSRSLPSDEVKEGERIDALCDALISSDPGKARQFVSNLQAGGVSPNALYLDYIAAAARRMGERWASDCASFLDVSIAAGRLCSLVRDLAPAFVEAEQMPSPAHSILITTVPGDTHSLGAAIAAEYFRHAGWDVATMDGATLAEIEDTVREQHFAVVGLSAGSRCALGPLAATVAAVKTAHADAIICVGGKILELEPDVITKVDADYGGADAASLALILRRQVSARMLAASAQQDDFAQCDKRVGLRSGRDGKVGR